MRIISVDPRSLLGSSVTDPPILILRLDFSNTLSGLPPVRFVPNRAALVVQGFVYEEFALNIAVPDEGEKDVPRTTIQMSNVDKRFMPFLEAGVLVGTLASLRMVLESDPATPIFTVDMDIESASATDNDLTFNVGYSELLDRAGVRLIYNRRGAPALFE